MTQNSSSDLTLSFVINAVGVSDNAAYITIRRNKGMPPLRTLSPAGRAWKSRVIEIADQAMRDAGLTSEDFANCLMEIDIHVQMPKNTIWRRDITNCSKLLLDGAVKAIGLDDRYVTRAVMTKSLGPERTEMTIRFTERT